MSARPRSPARPPTRRNLRIELLALDLSSCGRCAATSENLDEALRAASARLRASGVEAVVTRTVVTTQEQAVRLRLRSSPTIRVEGRDIALDVRESDCKDCGGLCGCTGIDCRVWVWKGREYEDAPVPMIVDAIDRAVADPSSAGSAPAGRYRLPENLRRFFRAKAAGGSGARGGCCPPKSPSPCCGSPTRRGR